MSDEYFNKVAAQTEAEMERVEPVIPIIVEQQEAPPPSPKKDQPVNAVVIVKFDSLGLPIFQTHQELTAAAAYMMQQTASIPTSLKKEGVEAVRAAIIFCKQHGLRHSSMNQLMYVRGKISAYGSLFTALAQRDPKFGQHQVFFLDEKQEIICATNKNLHLEVWAAVVSVKPKGAEKFEEHFFTMDEAKKAGLLSNDIYRKYPKDMLYHKANARALRANHAAALEGIPYYEDEVDIVDVTPQSTTLADKLANQERTA